MSTIQTTNIYVLKLKENKYYIGKSDNVLNRFQQHINGNGSSWTKKYKPISIEKTIENISSFEEDKITKEYLSKYGIDNVRGGSYVEIELTGVQKHILCTEIWAANDCCTRCGRSGHFIKKCYAKKDIYENLLEEEEDEEEEEEEEEEESWGCNYCDRTFTTKFGASVHEKSCIKKNKFKQSCYRCGRSGHYSSDCYASKHIKGYYL